MSETYTVSITVKVVDEAALQRAARRHAVGHDGLTDEDWTNLRRDDGNGSEADLSMMLDPGTLAGCEILETVVEVVNV